MYQNVQNVKRDNQFSNPWNWYLKPWMLMSLTKHVISSIKAYFWCTTHAHNFPCTLVHCEEEGSSFWTEGLVLLHRSIQSLQKSQLNFLQWLINKFSSLISLVGIDISMRGSLMWKENQRTLYLEKTQLSMQPYIFTVITLALQQWEASGLFTVQLGHPKSNDNSLLMMSN